MLSANTAADLTHKHCGSCHMLEKPQAHMIPTLTSPPMDSVIYHLGLVKENRNDKIKFIMDYAINPEAKKSVCESNKVQHYGVMPSLKGMITNEELLKISNYLIDNYPNEKFVTMINEIQKNDKMNALQNSPFLINKENLPHITSLLVKNWDKEKLGLTPSQKDKLLIVRKDTINGIKELKGQISDLENEVAEAMIDRENPNTVEEELLKIAKLKTDVTKIQLDCIFRTTQILNDEQIEYLLPFWE